MTKAANLAALGTSSGTSVLVSGTSVATTSGTSIDFTGIPSWVKRITIMINGVSTNGSSYVQFQIGDSGGIENTGYVSCFDGINSGTGQATASTGYIIAHASSGYLRTGSFTLTNMGSNTWILQGSNIYDQGTGGGAFSQGSKTLSDVLTQVRMTTLNGTDTFDAGSINILYE